MLRSPAVSKNFYQRLKHIGITILPMWYHDHSFDGVYAHYRRPIWQYILNKTKSKEIAEVLTQDVFLKAYRERESFNPKFRFSAWLWTIARNTVTDWYRKNSETFKHAPEYCPDK